MPVLSRIVEDASRSLAPIRGPRLAGERAAGGHGDPRRIEGEVRQTSAARFANDDIELLGRVGGGRGRPVVSVPSSAFFAQHLGQHPESRNPRQEQFTADVAYRDALDLGVAMERPAPLSLAI